MSETIDAPAEAGHPPPGTAPGRHPAHPATGLGLEDETEANGTPVPRRRPKGAEDPDTAKGG